MPLRLDRSYWTPVLLVVSLAMGVARAYVLHREGLEVGGELAIAAQVGAVLGTALLPWAAGALVAYGHWFWVHFRRDRQYVTAIYPHRRRALLHGTVLVVLVLMASEILWRGAIAYGVV